MRGVPGRYLAEQGVVRQFLAKPVHKLVGKATLRQMLRRGPYRRRHCRHFDMSNCTSMQVLSAVVPRRVSGWRVAWMQPCFALVFPRRVSVIGSTSRPAMTLCCSGYALSKQSPSLLQPPALLCVQLPATRQSAKSVEAALSSSPHIPEPPFLSRVDFS